MPSCEDCGDDALRRHWCWHCGLKVCPHCWNHIHRCEPGHRLHECRQYALYLRHGQKMLRALAVETKRSYLKGLAAYDEAKKGADDV